MWLRILILTSFLANAVAEIDFNRQIRPILSDKCFKCHGPDAKNQKSKYRLDSFEAATALSGVTPGNLDDSELHWRIRSDDSDEIMPPTKSKMSLTEAEKDLLDQWILEGAGYKKHWSLEALPAEILVPKTKGSRNAARNEIDHFIAAERPPGLSSNPETIPETWLRRATFDLTGLPPTIDEIDAFLADPNYEAAVDRLLASDAYAERMTSEWLDVARYADTYGYQQDRNRYVWPWRDWVIRAFQENMPYNQFVTWQLAGDLLPNATQDQILATCFNRLHSQKVEGGSVPEEFRIEYVADRVHTFGTAFLGLSFECTRCHDHKYDPLTQKDYFSLSAFFNNIDEAGLYSFFTSSVPTPTLELGEMPSDKKVRAAEAKLAKVEEALRSRSEESKDARRLPKPIVHLTFDELRNKALVDTQNPDKPAKTNSNNTIVSGKVGNGLKLTGDDAVTLPDKTGNFTRHQPFTIALWVKAKSKLDRAVILRRSKAWDDAASRGYELLLENGKLSAALIHFWPGNAIRVRATNELPLNEWTHVAISYDGSSRANGLTIYQNGAPAKSEVIRDNLTREITGGGEPFLALGQRMRDRGFKNGAVDELHLFDRLLTTSEIRLLATLKAKPGFAPPAPEKLHQARLALQKAREEYGAARQKLTEIMVMREMPGQRETHILERGLYSARGQIVTATTPAKLPPFPNNIPTNRLGLAKWLTAPNHPLLARVTVNRYWQMMFGRGLVSTSEDFGSQGKPPSHPELLDWLSRDFINSGWNVHHLLKKMVLSTTYRQTSNVSPEQREIDPENIYLARGPAYRLPAEMIRDSSLAVSGLLHRKIGGPGVNPYDLAYSFKPMKPDQAPNLHRRSVYTFWKRTAPAPVMMTLDSSKRDVCMVRRERTDSASQTLVLLNSPQFVEAARATAAHLVAEHGDNHAKLITHAFRLLTSRAPSTREHKILTQLLVEQQTAFADPATASKFLATGELEVETDNPTHLAAVTVLVSTLQNFDEAISKR